MPTIPAGSQTAPPISAPAPRRVGFLETLAWSVFFPLAGVVALGVSLAGKDQKAVSRTGFAVLLAIPLSVLLWFMVWLLFVALLAAFAASAASV